MEQPRQGLKGPKNVLKKQKVVDGTEMDTPKPAQKAKVEKSESEQKQAKAEKRKARRDRRKDQKVKDQEDEESSEDGGEKQPTTKTTGGKKQESQKPKSETTSKPAEAKSNKQGSATTKPAKVAVSKPEEMEEDADDSAADSDAPGEEDDEDDMEDVEDDASDEDVDDEMEDDTEVGDLANATFPGLAADDDEASDTSASDDESNTFDKAHESSASSASSILPDASVKNDTTNVESQINQTDGSTTETEPREKHPKLPQVDPQVLQERLQARLNALRAARKADGPNGKPARNRQELIEARRKKEESRKAHKKELRQKAKIAQDAETEAARLRGGSGSPMWSPGTFSPREPENNFSFGRVAFDDGAEMDASLTTVLDPRKKKGPQDAKTALEAVQNKRARLSGLDAAKRADIEEKDRWLSAKKRVSGEKVRDDTSLLKKTLKRKEKGKAKSEKEWGERIEGVKVGKEMKQKKREDNLRIRREGKGVKGKKKAPGAGAKAKAKGGARKRPGFEGSFRAGGGKGKA